MFENMTAEQFVQYVATDFIELSQEKVLIQRNDYVRIARQINERNHVPRDENYEIDDNF